MRGHQAGWALLIAILCAAPGARGQTAPAKGAPSQGGENPFNIPELRKYWNPVVGAGAVYEVTGADGTKRTEEFEILSEETIEGKKAYWLEIAVEIPNIAGKVYAKSLVTPADFRARKVIAQFPGMAAMEIPAGPASEMPKVDPKNAPKLVGTETITVAGGTFQCEHWRDADGSDVWLSAKVGPIKIVKSMDQNQKRVLVKTIARAQDGIAGPVKPYDPEAIKKFREQGSRE